MEDEEDKPTLLSSILLEAEKKPLTSNDVASMFSVEIHAARMFLMRLCRYGKLNREKLNIPSGGIYYRYTLTIGGREKVEWLHDIGF